MAQSEVSQADKLDKSKRNKPVEAIPQTEDQTIIEAPSITSSQTFLTRSDPSTRTLRQNAVMRMQQTHGNRAVQRMLAKRGSTAQGGTVVQRNPFDWPVIDEKKPKEVVWDVAASGSVDNLASGWDEKPNFPNGYLAHEATSELDSGKTAFQKDWAMVSQSWNDVSRLAAQYNIQAQLPATYVSDIDGKPTPPPPKSVEAPGLEGTRPTGKQDYQVGSIFNTSNQLDMKTPFDPNNLVGADRAQYDTAKLNAVTARTARDNAEIDVDSKLTAVGTAWSKLRQAQIKEKQAQKTEESKDVAIQKVETAGQRAQLEAIIKGAEGVISAGVKKDPVASASALAGTLTSLYYNDKLTALDAKLALLDAEIATLQVSYEMENVKQAMNDIRTATNEVKKIVGTLDIAMATEKKAFADFATVVETLGTKMGLDAESIKIARTAAAALPLIEETIGHISQIIGAIHIPFYSQSSGIGAGLVTNVDTFKMHLASLKAYYYSIWALRATWNQRRDAAQSGVGIPARLAAP